MGYLDRLKGMNSEKRPLSPLPKLPKAPYGSYDSNQGGRFQKIASTARSADEAATVSRWWLLHYPDRDSPEQIAEAARQLAEVRAAYAGTALWMKAPNGEPTKLTERQWLQVRTPMFKAWFGDWENSAILNGQPLALLKTDDVPAGGFKVVEDWAAELFASQGGKATRAGLGEVILDHRAAQASMGHGGANKYKKIAFAAVKDVIERGALVWQGSDGREDSFYFSAPVDIDGTANIETVLVHRDFNTQRMYLHSVTTKENLLNQRVSSVDAEASERSGSIDSAGISSLLQDAIKGKGVSKVVDANGEPLVVYHGTASDISRFDADRLSSSTGDAAAEGFFFADSTDEANVYAREAAFKSDPKAYEGGAKGGIYARVTGRGECGEPVAAGLSDLPGVIRYSPDQGATCPAWLAILPGDLEARIRAMSGRWNYCSDDLALALAGARADPAGWLRVVEADENEGGE